MNAPLEELVKTLGLPAALRLVERFGGVRIYLPRAENLKPGNQVAGVIGLEAARDLCALWPQERPYIPRAAQFLRDARDRALLADAAKHTVPQLARNYELTERQVYNVLKRGVQPGDAVETAPPAQKVLF